MIRDLPHPKTNMNPLNVDAWKMEVPFEMDPFLGDMLIFLGGKFI